MIRNIYILLLLLLFSFSNYIVAQEIPNSDFQNWVITDGIEEPQYWSTANRITYVNPINVLTTTKTEDSHKGNYAVKLESKTILSFVAPGFITLGDFDFDLWTQNIDITGGIPFDIRPDKIELYYKYSPAENDNMRIGLWLLRNIDSQTPDTVGVALFESGETVENYKKISLDIDYRIDEQPEILNIIAVSSNPDNPVAGSVLKVDDIVITCSLSKTNYILASNIIYPNPVSEYINFSEKYFNYKVEIFNSLMIKIKEFNIRELQYNAGDLTPGKYIIRITNENKNISKIQRFIKI